MNNVWMFCRVFFSYQKLHKTFSISSSSSSLTKLNSTMKTFIDSKEYRKVLNLFEKQSEVCTDVEINMVLKACTNLNEYQHGMKIHRQLSPDSLNNPLIQTSLIRFYTKSHDIDNAFRLFSTIIDKSNYTYTAMFKGLISHNMSDKVLDLLDEMIIKPNQFTLAVLFNACTQLSNDQAKIVGRKLLHQMPKYFRNDTVLLTSAIDMLMRFGDVKEAEKLFEMMAKKNIITYGAMINGYVNNKIYEKALDLFEQIPFNLNEVICTIGFNACTQLSTDRAKIVGRKLLEQMPKHFRNNNVLLNSAIYMLMKFGDVREAEDLFEMMAKKDIITYGAMINGYVNNKIYEKALDLFEQIPFNLDEVMYTIIFNTCAQLLNDRAKRIGKKLLHQMPNHFRNANVLLNSAIYMLMKFGDVREAENLFEMMAKKNIITYGAMMKGFNINKEPLKSLILFEKMKEAGIIPDSTIFITVIGACARMGMSYTCQSIVAQLPAHFYDNLQLRTALIDMWGKAGSVKNAQEIFLSVDKPDAFTYNAMINAFGLNRMGLEAVQLYHEMPNNIRDEVSTICVLNACSHSALLSEAQSIFNEISDKTENIISTMIDCFSRLFLFDEAQKLISDYEKCNPPSSTMYMAMLSGARTSRHYTLSEKIYKRMKSLFPDQKDKLIAGSILLCNVYSSIGDDQQAETIRLNRLKELGTRVKVGISWTEVNGEIVQFKAHDHSHPRSEEIYAELRRLSAELIEYGHVYDSSWITRPLHDDETIESVLCGHSEKLAIAFNFIQETKPTFIQITKNLRVCGDCHQATKLIAKIRQCKIIVRDANCIHHFSPNGTCSCQDHF